MTGDVEPIATVRGCLLAIGRSLALEGVHLDRDLVGGKLLRARLVLTAAAVGGSDGAARARSYATAIELIHGGALMHDDVVDGSPERRGQATLAERFGARIAVSAGLWALVRAIECLAGAPPSTWRMLARAVRDVARGQTDELVDLYAEDVSPEGYLRRIYGKTGALYELAARLGAQAACVDRFREDALARYAAKLGCAYQLADDVRDIVGGCELGRETGTDLREGVYTYPILLILGGRCPGGEQIGTLLRQTGTASGRQQCAALLRRSGALGRTLAETRELIDQALLDLAVLPRSVARLDLEKLARSLLSASLCDAAGPDGDTARRSSDQQTGSALAASTHPASATRPTGNGDAMSRSRQPDARRAIASLPAGSLLARLTTIGAESAAGTSPDAMRQLRGALLPAMVVCTREVAEDAIACTAALLSLLRELSDLRPADTSSIDRAAHKRDATLVGAIDLLYAELISVLARAPAAAGVDYAHRLAVIVRSEARSGLAALQASQPQRGELATSTRH